LWRIPNGVDAGLFAPEGPAADSLPGEAPRPWIAFSGELRLKKGLPLLLDLAELMEREGRGTLFALGGVRGDGAEELESWRRRQAAGRRLRVLPYDSDPARLAAVYRAMDLFVFPSLWEGMPNALLEAMACAKPTLASAVGAFPEVLRHGENGFLVPAERLAEFPREALRVAALPAAELARVGGSARAEVLARYTPEAERDAILALYRRLVGVREDRPRRAAAPV
jgi:glycosyltransferase involved in cell wall biosynthesis